MHTFFFKGDIDLLIITNVQYIICLRWYLVMLSYINQEQVSICGLKKTNFKEPYENDQTFRFFRIFGTNNFRGFREEKTAFNLYWRQIPVKLEGSLCTILLNTSSGDPGMQTNCTGKRPNAPVQSLLVEGHGGKAQ